MHDPGCPILRLLSGEGWDRTIVPVLPFCQLANPLPRSLAPLLPDSPPSAIISRCASRARRGESAMREIVTYVFGLALLGNACLFVPQALAIWRKKSDEGVSLITFGGFCILQVIGVVHGFYEHDNSLIVGLGASFLTCGTVTLLTIVYRLRRLRAVA
jgi:MtN3 and saliva related transmembrane protein